MSALAGFIVVDKPTGATSFAMVKLVRRLTGARRVGHAGTLDPLASGVLPVALGVATRLIEYLDDATKAYLARIQLGVETDTYDADGDVTERRDASAVTAAQVEEALGGFVGDVEQVPPVYSAVKVSGRPLYRYAREGIEVTAAARTVRIDSIVLRWFEAAVAEVEVRCGKGTYVRSIAHDLGQRLGVGAHLAGLVRLESGGFSIGDAIAPERLKALAEEGRIEDVVLAPDRAVERRPAAILGDERSGDVLLGRDVRFEGRAGVELCRAYSTGGDFVGVLRQREAGWWHPEKVFTPA